MRPSGTTLTTNSTVQVAAAPLTVQGGLFVQSVTGAPLQAMLASFSDANLTESEGSSKATVHDLRFPDDSFSFTDPLNSRAATSEQSPGPIVSSVCCPENRAPRPLAD